jgi:hypothetical protein
MTVDRSRTEHGWLTNKAYMGLKIGILAISVSAVI